MVKRILFADLICPSGHVNFNRIYLDALIKESNISVDCLFDAGFIKLLFEDKLPVTVFSYKRPCRWTRILPFKLRFFFEQIRRQNHANELCKKEHYDLVFFTSFYTLSFLFFQPRVNTMVVCHNNLDLIYKHPRLLKAIRIICNKVKLITLNEVAHNHLLAVGVKNIFIPHGILFHDKKSLILPDINTRYIIVPVGSDMDKSVYEIVLTKKFDDFLRKNGVVMYVRHMIDDKSFSSIKELPKHMDFKDYISMVYGAEIILLPYNKETYKYRSSALLLEGVALGKNIIAPNSEAFTQYKKQDDKGLYFYDNGNQIESIVYSILNDSSPVTYTNLLDAYSLKRISTSIIKYSC